MSKNNYVAPEMEVLGSFESLTQGGSQTGDLDAQFPVGTPNVTGVFS